ncbi:DNA photolyase family protein [Granulosicoccus sp.]|nr:deoxyribodipyrimidine photo-lyase [Granulosicoccus sp.]MDB4222674.1 DNA photolyase family protein [Granulosicoccus sp.]
MESTVHTIGIVWFRQDLRLSDNPALTAACRECDQILPVFIDDPREQTLTQIGAASRVWLHHSLLALQQSLQDKGSDLLVAQGASLDVLNTLVAEIGAHRIFWNRCYDPITIERDSHIKQALAALKPKTFNGLLLHEPWENLKADGTPYKVFTAYWRKAAAQIDNDLSSIKPLSAPRQIKAIGKLGKKSTVRSSIDQLCLLPTRNWHEGMMQTWVVGEKAAQSQTRKFLKNSAAHYTDARNLPAVEGTSMLSAHLHFGEITPKQIIYRLLGENPTSFLPPGELTFAKEIVWREFAHNLIYHFPQIIEKPLDTRFEKFKWADNTAEHLKAWQKGQTGVPIVDAGMRQLYATGWMHNRVRMVVGSYLVKNLLIPWQAGEQWFRDTLVDADLASNSMGWQWVAGCGADAAPYFRVFNPVLQGEKFDKQGEYVRRWVPELESVPDKFVHKPWELDAQSCAALDYPHPLVDLKVTRQRALDAFSAIKGTK